MSALTLIRQLQIARLTPKYLAKQLISQVE